MAAYPPRSANAPASLSRRKGLVTPFRLAASGPWQVKQAFERIGRISRLKSIGRDGDGGSPANAPPPTRYANAVVKTNAANGERVSRLSIDLVDVGVPCMVSN